MCTKALNINFMQQSFVFAMSKLKIVKEKQVSKSNHFLVSSAVRVCENCESARWKTIITRDILLLLSCSKKSY